MIANQLRCTSKSVDRLELKFTTTEGPKQIDTYYAGNSRTFRHVEAMRMSHSAFVMSRLSHEKRPAPGAAAPSWISLLVVSSGIASGRGCAFSPPGRPEEERLKTGERRAWLIAGNKLDGKGS